MSGCMGCEMHVGYKWLLVPICFELGRDVSHVLCLAGPLRGKADQFAACINDTLGAIRSIVLRSVTYCSDKIRDKSIIHRVHMMELC